jgi:hypothetical protein
VSYVFLCIVPFLSFVVAGVRAFRVPGVYQAAGVAYFAAIAITVWVLSARALRAAAEDRRLLAGAGVLLVTPFALVALLWVGVGPPWVATAAENQMRYLVLIVMTSAVAAVRALKEVLSGAGERCYSTLGFAAIMLSGPLYLIWNSFEFAAVFGKIHAGAVPAAIVSLGDMGDLLLFMAGFLTYLATVAFAASLGRVQWLGRRATAFLIEWSRVVVKLRSPVSGSEGALYALVHQSRFCCRNPSCPIHHAFPVGRRLAPARG